MWELGITVLASSEIPEKEILGSELIALGDSTRNVRDAVIGLNSRGISSFTWILHEFERIQEIIHNTLPEPPTTPGSSRSNTPARMKRKSVDVPLETLVTNLVEKIARDLSDILQDLDRAIPLADQASTQGGRLLVALSSEHAELRRTKEQRSLLDSFAVAIGAGSTWKSKQLQRDLALSEESVTQVATIRRGLELARSSFLEYHNNVGHFKVSSTIPTFVALLTNDVIGWNCRVPSGGEWNERGGGGAITFARHDAVQVDNISSEATVESGKEQG